MTLRAERAADCVQANLTVALGDAAMNAAGVTSVLATTAHAVHVTEAPCWSLITPLIASI